MSASRTISAALAAIALLVSSMSPAAAAGPSIGRLGVGGTGCPAGTVSASLSNGGSTLSLRFSQYRASAGGARTLDRKPCALEVALGFHDVGLVHPELAAVPCIPRIPFRRDMTAEPDAPSLLDSLGEELDSFAQRVEVHLKTWCEIAPKPAVLRDPVHQQLRGRTVEPAHRDELRFADHLDTASRPDPFARKLGNRVRLEREP